MAGATAGDVRPVDQNGDVTGLAVLPPSGSKKPVYLSPGHRTSMELCRNLAGSLFAGHRVPEPIFAADRLSREVALAANPKKARHAERR